MKIVSRRELLKMNADDLFRTFQTSEEVCSFINSRPYRLSNLQIGKFKTDDELSDHIDSLLDSCCAYYVDEIKKGFETNADLTELVTKLQSEPILMHMHLWSKIIKTTDVQFLKYAHKYLVTLVLKASEYMQQHSVSCLTRVIVEDN